MYTSTFRMSIKARGTGQGNLDMIFEERENGREDRSLILR